MAGTCMRRRSMRGLAGDSSGRYRCSDGAARRTRGARRPRGRRWRDCGRRSSLLGGRGRLRGRCAGWAEPCRGDRHRDGDGRGRCFHTPLHRAGPGWADRSGRDGRSDERGDHRLGWRLGRRPRRGLGAGGDTGRAGHGHRPRRGSRDKRRHRTTWRRQRFPPDRRCHHPADPGIAELSLGLPIARARPAAPVPRG